MEEERLKAIVDEYSTWHSDIAEQTKVLEKAYKQQIAEIIKDEPFQNDVYEMAKKLLDGWYLAADNTTAALFTSATGIEGKPGTVIMEGIGWPTYLEEDATDVFAFARNVKKDEFKTIEHTHRSAEWYIVKVVFFTPLDRPELSPPPPPGPSQSPELPW